MLYCAATRGLAALETLVHLDTTGLPLNRYLVAIDIPDAHWETRERVDADSLVGWDAIPPGQASLAFGDAWLAQARTLVLEVPSVVVPEESCVLINPLHDGAAELRATKVRKWLYDPRILSGPRDKHAR